MLAPTASAQLPGVSIGSVDTGSVTAPVEDTTTAVETTATQAVEDTTAAVERP